MTQSDCSQDNAGKNSDEPGLSDEKYIIGKHRKHRTKMGKDNGTHDAHVGGYLAGRCRVWFPMIVVPCVFL